MSIQKSNLNHIFLKNENNNYKQFYIFFRGVFILEKNGKINKKRISTFMKKQGLKHFSATGNPISDVLGSYTGTPVNSSADTDYADLYPTQDADDL